MVHFSGQRKLHLPFMPIHVLIEQSCSKSPLEVIMPGRPDHAGLSNIVERKERETREAREARDRNAQPTYEEVLASTPMECEDD